MNNEELKLKSLELQKSVVSLLNGMLNFNKKYPKAELPTPSTQFLLSKELLEKGEFNLAVCGKVKNGKSSLINALIGRNLLPVCTDVATSRVFKISHSQSNQDEFYLVFANGDRKKISEKQLAIYGNQSEIDKVGETDIESTIAYIQVYTKLDFLPENVSVIDTPGVGSTYPQHTAITKQYIKMADAVLFVLNPTPMEKMEIEFLKEIASITPGIVFVTTKIDDDNVTDVDTAIENNVEKIKKAIGEKLLFGLNMKRMSSTLLLSAAIEKDDLKAKFNYDISGFEEVKDSIISTVFLTQGIYRTGVAYNSCLDYYKAVLKSIELRREKVKAAQIHYDELLAEYETANNQFSTQMGETKKRDVLSQADTIIRTMEADFSKIFATKGEITNKYFEEIDMLTSDDIQMYSEDLGNKVVSDVQNSWDNLTKLVQKRISDILAQYNEECKMSIPKGLISITNENESAPDVHGVELRERIGKMRNEMFLGTALTGAIGTVVGTAYYFLPALVTPALPVLAPVLVVLGLGAVLWGAISGNAKAKQEKLQKNKNALKNYVQETISSCRKQLVDTSLADNKYQSLYQGFVQAIKQQVNNSVNEIYNLYKSELETMKKAVLESKQDPKLIDALDYLLKIWSSQQEQLQQISSTLNSVKI